MKKIAFVVLLIAVVISGLLGGTTMAAPSPPVPTLVISPATGSAGTQVGVEGSGWATNSGLQVFLDDTDNLHLLGTTTTNSKGILRFAFTMTATTVGVHNVIAKQGVKQASATFALTATEPIDERTNEALSGIATRVGAIWSRLTDGRASNLDLLPLLFNQQNLIYGLVTNPNCGLDHISMGVAGLQTQVNNLDNKAQGIASDVTAIKTDLASTKSDVAAIKTDVQGIKSDLAQPHLQMRQSSGEVSVSHGVAESVYDSHSPENQVRHVSLTMIYRMANTGNNEIRVIIIPSIGSLILAGGYEIKYECCEEKLVTYEFDAIYWTLSALGFPSAATMVSWAATETWWGTDEMQ